MRGGVPSSSNRSLPRQLRKSLGNDGVIVLVSRRATAEQSQGFSSCVPDFVFLPGRNGNGIPSLDLSRLVFDPHASIATSDVIYLLGNPVVMFLGRITRVNARFGRMEELRCASNSRISDPSMVLKDGTVSKFVTSTVTI